MAYSPILHVYRVRDLFSTSSVGINIQESQSLVMEMMYAEG